MTTKEQKIKIFENTISGLRMIADSNKKLDVHEKLEEKYRRLQTY
ncbi:MAG: hypothetical protein OEY17_00570 [Nitrosopumilus sp.]|nr:hypothetical protein [Nitrosopumilus sp.]MDH5657830.1 hypothetical protein [Nitrosopumilus sp.]